MSPMVGSRERLVSAASGEVDRVYFFMSGAGKQGLP